MTWMQFSHGLRLDPIAKGSPEALGWRYRRDEGWRQAGECGHSVLE
jgi:hypothetical protein